MFWSSAAKLVRTLLNADAETDVQQKWCPKPADDIKILLCGPPPMIRAMKDATEKIGFAKARPVSKLEDQVFAF